MTDAQVQETLTRHVEALGENFESVTIFVTWPREGGGSTRYYHRGTGNWFAQYGAVRQWLTEEDQRIKSQVDIQEREDS